MAVDQALNWADSSSEITWRLLNHNGKSTWAENGSYVVQKTSRVLVHERPVLGTRLQTWSWISQVGTSSFRMQARISDLFNPKRVYLESDIVKVMVLQSTGKKASKLFFDPQWARHRFAKSPQLPFDQGPPFSENAKSEACVFRVDFTNSVRHTDQDQNGHINSAKYMNFVHDARAAALEPSSPWPEWVKSLARNDGWIHEFGVDHIAEVKLGDSFVMEAFLVDGVFWFDMLGNEGKVACRVWVRPNAANQHLSPNPLPHLKDPAWVNYDSVEGCDPTSWGVVEKAMMSSSL